MSEARQLSLFDHTLRPLHEVVLAGIDALLSKHEWLVAPVPIAEARRLVEQYHYAGGASNTGVFLHGLYHRSAPHTPMGVAWWLPPIHAAATWADPANFRGVLQLHRLAIAPEAPKNAASFVVGRSIRLIRQSAGYYTTLLTYADEWRGHRGTIYHASNWRYRNTTRPLPVWTDADGRAVSPKRGPKTLTVAEMRARGYELAGRFCKHRFTIALGGRS